jgi:tetratricopeptide (TPR) repeat protein
MIDGRFATSEGAVTAVSPTLAGPASDEAQTAAGNQLFTPIESAITVFGDPSQTVKSHRNESARATAANVTRTVATSATRNSGPLEGGQAFGSRYHIIRPLGVGGMGAVYQAWDAELGVAVAIKVIRPEIMADPGAAEEVERRFKRELLLARQVTHKNVVRIHDLGEINGIKYITMSYVDGTELATLLKEQGKLAVPALMRIARSVVSGLVAAHAAGVVHRDLKPANIMIGRDGDALIMDFGIARSTGGVAGGAAPEGGGLPGSFQGVSSRPEATMQGSIVGTIEYMAPEQARGESVDQRADIYAFGLILYDALVGARRAKQAESAIAELRSRMERPPPPLKSVVPDVPSTLADLISQCLEPDPAKRFQTTKELETALGRLDDQGQLIPVRRVLGLPAVAVVVILLLALSVGIWWYQRQFIPAVAHEPVSIVIADVKNATGDPAFDRALEPTLKRALEDASFISAYDRAAISETIGVRPPDQLDEAAARELAVKQGLNLVLSGSVERQGNGYTVGVKAVQSVTGEVVATASGKASSRNEVLGAAVKLVTSVRQALGDDLSDSARQFAMVTLSATSLDVVRHHAAGMEAMSSNKFEEALQSYQKAVDLDPKFGMGYQGMAGAALNLGRRQDAEKYINEALRHVDGMTERERYSTRGLLYLVTGDYQACVKEFGDLVARYTADALAHNQVALCLTYLRNLPKALEEVQQAVSILPKRVLYRINLSLYASYSTDFQTGEREARATYDQGSKGWGLFALALAQLGQGQLTQAAETYRALAKVNNLGVSQAASGLGDLAIYQGRASDAVRILREGAAADLAANNGERASAKFALLARAHLLRQQNDAAVSAAEKALENSKAAKIRFLASQIFVEAGQSAKARVQIEALANELQTEPQAYAKISEGALALKNKDPRQAIKLFLEGNNLLDTWIGHFELGRAYLELGQFAQADSEFDRCKKRRGEALSLFLDEEPTFSFLPLLHYYQGRTREGLKSEGFADSYREYLSIRGTSTEDPLLPEIRRRAAG